MSVLIFDTETTDRNDGEVIEAAYLVMRDCDDLLGSAPDRIPHPLAFRERFCQRYRPSKPMTYGSLAVHHILPSELEECPPSSSFELPPGATYLVGHNIDFDWKAIGSPSIKRICTLALAQHTWPEIEGYSQVALIYRLLGPTASTRDAVRGAHGALADVHLNLALLDEILALQPAITTWSALHAFSEQCRVPIYCPLKRWDGIKLEDMDDSSIRWCLRQDFIDPYFRLGLERVMAARYPMYTPAAGASAY